MINPKILNSRCHRFIRYCLIGIINPRIPKQNFDKLAPKNITQRDKTYHNWIKIHGVVDNKLIYFGKENEAEMQLQMHYSGIHQCNDMIYDKNKAKHYYQLSKLDHLPEKTKNCPVKCAAFKYCQEDKIPPFFLPELYEDTFLDDKWVFGPPEAGNLGLSDNHLQQFESKEELRFWLDNHRK